MNRDNPLTITPACLAIITESESLRLQAYLCPKNILTIGWGHVLLPKFDAKLFQINSTQLASLIDECQHKRFVTDETKKLLNISRDKALELLNRDVSQAALFVRSVTPVALNQHQYDALVSLVFNIGQGQYSTSTLRKKLNQGDYLGAAAQFSKWIYGHRANGEKYVLPGLVTRRAKERDLFENAYV